MAWFINFLLNFIQYHYIIYGFSYVYIDIGKRIIKFYIYLKIYVYILNLIYAGLTIYCLLRAINQTKLYFKNETLLEISYNILYMSHIFIFVNVIFRRIKEETYLKKWFKIFLPLQINYFDKLTQLPCDKSIERFQIFNILLILLQNYYVIYLIILKMIELKWSSAMDMFVLNLFAIMENYIMIHHIFILCYIKYVFLKLNHQLRNGQINEYLVQIYIKLSLLMREVNRINGPLIFGVLLCQLMNFSIHLYTLFEMIIDSGSIMFVDITYPCIVTVLFINMFVYFLICDQLYKTTLETGELLMLYDTANEMEQVIYKIVDIT